MRISDHNLRHSGVATESLIERNIPSVGCNSVIKCNVLRKKLSKVKVGDGTEITRFLTKTPICARVCCVRLVACICTTTMVSF